MDLKIRVLTDKDAGEFFRLRCQSLLAVPEAFLASPGDDLVSSEDAARELLRRGLDAAVFGACTDGLHGMLGLYRARHLKCAHKIHLWGMFVLPEWRRQGIGNALLHAAIAHARALQGVSSVHLSVSGATAAAERLYQRAGFAVWGLEPEAIRFDGRSFDEHHMVMKVSAD